MAKPFEFEDYQSPFASADYQRSLARRTAAPSEAPVEYTDPYKGNWAAETTRSHAANIANDFTNGVGFLAAGLVGADDARQRLANQYLEEQQRAREIGPQIQSFDDAEAAGGGFGNYGAALGYQAAGLVPDLVATATGIGAGGTVARGVARRAVTHSVADAIERKAVNVAARDTATQIATRRAALAAPDGAQAVSNAVHVAKAQVNEASRKAAMREAVEIAGRTPRTGTNPFAATIEAAGKTGGRIGGTVASVPGLNGAMNAEKAADANTSTSDMWKLAAGTTAAAATQVIPLERFFGRFGKEALDEVAKKGERLLPRMVKEFGKQGLAEGSQEVTQQALQLASHAWVEKNLDRLTDDDAIDSYIASFAAGALIGGALGSAGEAGRGAGRAAAQAGRRVAQGARWTREKVAETLGGYAERARKARFTPGEAMGAAGDAVVAATGASPRDLLRRGMDAARGVGEAVVGAGKSAADRFRGFQDDIAFDEDLSQRVDAVYDAWEQGGAPMILGERRAKNQNPVALKDPLQAHLMSYVRADSPIWGMPEATQRVAKALGRLFEGNPTVQDRRDLEGLVESGSLPRETMDSMAVIGQQWNGLHKLVRRSGADAETDAPEADGTMAAQLRDLGLSHSADPSAQLGEHTTRVQREDAAAAAADAGMDPSQILAEGDLTNDALAERTGNADGVRVHPGDRLANARAALRAVRERTDNDPERIAATKEFRAAKADLRAHILGKNENSGNGTVFIENKKAGAAAWSKIENEIKNSANRIEIEPVDVKNAEGKVIAAGARRALSLDSLVTKYVNQVDDFDTSTPEGEQARAKAALGLALADLKSAGIKVRIDSITPGWFGNKGRANNGTYIGRLTPRDVAEWKTALQHTGKQPSISTAEGAKKIGKVRSAVPMSDAQKKRAAEPIERRRFKEPDHKEAVQGEHEIDSGNVDTDRTLAPRSRPPGAKTADGDFVSSEAVVEDVRTGDSLGEIARRAREEAVTLGLADDTAPVKVTGDRDAAADAPRPRAKAYTGVDPRFNAGVEIGTKLLERERDTGAISERRFNVQMRRLREPESGLAQKYYNDAFHGKYVEASVSERKADKAKTDTRALRKEEKAFEEQPDPKLEPGRSEPKVEGNQPEKRTEKMQANREKAAAETASKPKRRVVKKDEFADDVEAAATSDEDTHDTVRETAMLNEMLKRMGIKFQVRVVSSGEVRGGSYSPGLGRIRINPKLTGAERIEVLAHELGHHIVFAEIAKAAGLDIKDVPNGQDAKTTAERFALLEKHNPELYAALKADFETWKAANPRSQKWSVTRASRAPMHRAMAALGRGINKTTEELGSDHIRYTYQFDEYLADQISRALTTRKEGRSVIQKFFADIAQQLREAYRMLIGAQRKEWLPAKSVDDWIKGLFNAEKAAVRAATGVGLPQKAANASVRAAAADSVPGARFSRANLNDLVEFVKYTLPREERAILERVFSRAKANILLKAHWDKEMPGASTLMDDAKQGMEMRIALGYLAWKEGAFNTGPEGRAAFKGLRDSLAELAGASAEGELAHRVLSDIANGTVQHFVDRNKTYSVRELEARARGNAQRALNWVSEQGPVSDALAKFWQGTYSRMADSGLPALRELGAILQRPHGATGDDHGMLPAIRAKTYRYHRQFAAAFKDLNPGERVRALSVLQRAAGKGDPAYDGKSDQVRAAVDAVRSLMDEVYGELRATGVFDETFNKRDLFFPVLLDMRQDGAVSKLEALYRQPKFRQHVLEATGMKDKDYDKAIKLLVDAAVDGDRTTNLMDKAAAHSRHLNKRLSAFVYEHGDANDRKVFASLQTKNADEVFARYFPQIIKTIEAGKRFGAREEIGDSGKTRWNARAKFDTMLADIRKQGGTDEDVKLAEDAVAAALGSYGMDGSPTLAAFSPTLAKKLSGPKTKAFVAGTQAYENLRLLPLAILSSLVDPMGVAVRTGGDFKQTWDGVRAGIRSLTNKKDAKEMLALLEDIGVADDFMPAIASHPVFDGDEGSFARKVNEAVFKWNGMNAWVRATRVMAAHAGHRFLLKHAAGDGDSARYLAELGLEAGDITENPDKPGQVVLNDKTRTALQQFVDEAVLRPNALQVPLWHRDPFMGLITQYKAFGYAIYDQITTRIFRELEHGNFRVLTAAASYLPIIVFAELLRELIQHGTEGNPNRKDWGPGDYTLYATSRSGLLGPQAGITGDLKDDVEHNRLPGTSLLGPAGQQAGNVVKAFEGRRDLGKELESALPGSAAYKNWNDDSQSEEAA